MIGQRITTPVLHARWAYGEITSPRFANFYRGGVPPDLMQKASDGIPFEALEPNETALLTALQSQVRQALLPFLSGINEFVCESWSKATLMRVYTLPALDPQRRGRLVPLISFVASPRFLDANGNPEPTDPRVAADQVPLTEAFVNSEPVPVGLWQGYRVLIDGYRRSILFLRSENLQGEILAWVPVERKP
jgi:hypothetical protein